MIYFDNASTTWPKPETVYTEADCFFRQHAVNTGRGQYKAAAHAGDIVKQTREDIKTLLHGNANYETIFTSSATEALNTILQGIDFGWIKTVYITHFEHNAVLRTILYLQKRYAFAIIYLSMTKNKTAYHLKAIEKQFAEHPPDLIVMSHASNVCGLVAPVADICELARKHNAITVLDMAQTAGLLDIDLTALGVNAAVFAGHKTLYGPLGAAGFMIKKDFYLNPLLYGGTGLYSAKPDMPENLPERYEAGSRNVQAIAGLHHAIAWLRRTGVQTIFQKEQALKQELLTLLSRHKNTQIVGDNAGIGIVSCVFAGYAPDNIGQVLDEHFDIAVRTGLHCAPGAHKLLKTAPSGTVRFSLGYFNEQNDLDCLDGALAYIEKHG